MYKSVQKFQKYQLNKKFLPIMVKSYSEISVGKFVITLIKLLENIVVGSKDLSLYFASKGKVVTFKDHSLR